MNVEELKIMETNHRTIVIMKGIPGSGKSTKAKEYVSMGFKKVGKDEIRRMINNYSLDNSDEKIIDNIQKEIVKHLMYYGKNIVIDNTHAKKKYYNDIVKYIYAVGAIIDYKYEIIVDFIDTPLNECIKRNSKRTFDKVPESVIRNMHKTIYW